LRASNPRPSDGRVTVLAYALGEEDFVDNNANNVFDAGDTFTDKIPAAYRDDSESGAWNAGEPCIGNCPPPPTGNSQYDGVQYLSKQLVQIFSGSHALFGFNPAAPLTCTAGIASALVTVTDQFGRIMPADTKIEFSVVFATPGATVTPAEVKVNNVILGVGDPLLIPSYPVAVGCPGGSGTLFVKATTPNGVETTTSVPIN
jgi:hypothetical protein